MQAEASAEVGLRNEPFWLSHQIYLRNLAEYVFWKLLSPPRSRNSLWTATGRARRAQNEEARPGVVGFASMRPFPGQTGRGIRDLSHRTWRILLPCWLCTRHNLQRWKHPVTIDQKLLRSGKDIKMASQNVDFLFVLARIYRYHARSFA